MIETGWRTSPTVTRGPNSGEAAWVLSMGGGYFVTGFEKTYYGGEPWRGAKFDPDDERNVEVVSDLQNLKKFFEARMWWKLTPADSLVTARYGLTFPYRDFSKYGCRFPDDTRLCTKNPVSTLTHRSIRPF
jgi:hypothetical protein